MTVIPLPDGPLSISPTLHPPSLSLSSVYPPATPKLDSCSVVFAFSGKTEEESQTKQLEFEDVWLASQVEPLQDDFDILGRFALDRAVRQENKQKVSNLIGWLGGVKENFYMVEYKRRKSSKQTSSP